MGLCTFTRGLCGSSWEPTGQHKATTQDELHEHFTPHLNQHPCGSGAAREPQDSTETPQGTAQAGITAKALKRGLISHL